MELYFTIFTLPQGFDSLLLLSTHKIPFCWLFLGSCSWNEFWEMCPLICLQVHWSCCNGMPASSGILAVTMFQVFNGVNLA